MIQRKVSAALLLRDGFTGAAFTSGASLACFLDGYRFRPLWKQGGYLILMDLEPGEHELRLSCRSYRDCRVRFTVGDGPFPELEIGMEPGEGYPFPRSAARLRIMLEGVAGDTPLWAAMAGPLGLRLAQGPSKERAPEVRVFCKGSPALLPVPGHFLAADAGKAGPELLHVLRLEGETALLERPPEKNHPRGTPLLPVRSFRPDPSGRTELVFPGTGQVFLLYGTAWKALDLAPGTQELNWTWQEAEK